MTRRHKRRPLGIPFGWLLPQGEMAMEEFERGVLNELDAEPLAGLVTPASPLMEELDAHIEHELGPQPHPLLDEDDDDDCP